MHEFIDFEIMGLSEEKVDEAVKMMDPKACGCIGFSDQHEVRDKCGGGGGGMGARGGPYGGDHDICSEL
jgi:hypothetical protein